MNVQMGWVGVSALLWEGVTESTEYVILIIEYPRVQEVRSRSSPSKRARAGEDDPSSHAYNDGERWAPE